MGLAERAMAQEVWAETEHYYPPKWNHDPILRAKYASTAELPVEHVHGNVYAIFGAGGNITVSVGPQGLAVVNSGDAANIDKVIAVLKKLGDGVDPTRNSIPVPVRVILNTDVQAWSTGGNEKLQAAAEFVRGGEHIMAHENVLARMSEPLPGQKTPPRSSDAWPTDTFRNPTNKFGRFFNGEGLQLIHVPAAHTDGDSIIWFRYSDVMATGDFYSTETWPRIDVEKGGTYQGVLNALNLILRTGISDFRTEDGTRLVPAHGRITDLADVGMYRDMLTIIRDRILDGKKRGLSLEQVKAAKPTQGWEARFGSRTGTWTTDMFLDAAYKTIDVKAVK
jgi:glyoxylase-like metal-dependent hydrolase (beta-lactamase superfamily II)